MGSDLGVAVDLVTPDVVAQLKKGEVRVTRVVSLDVPPRWRSEEKARVAPLTNRSRVRRTLEAPVARASRWIARVAVKPPLRATDVHLPPAPVQTETRGSSPRPPRRRKNLKLTKRKPPFATKRKNASPDRALSFSVAFVVAAPL